MKRVQLAYPQATPTELALLKKSFESYLASVKMWGPHSSVAMPSQSVDEVWHQALLHSQFYERLCFSQVGWFVHHVPGPLPGSQSLRTASDIDLELSALARAWVGACTYEGFHWEDGVMPSLFSVDRLLNIKEGIRFSRDPHGHIEQIITRARELSF